MNGGRLPIVALRKILLACFLIAVAPIGAPAQTAAIRVLVVDGRTGKSLSGMDLTFVEYHSGHGGDAHPDVAGQIQVKTTVDGDSYVANPDAHGVLIFGRFETGYWTPCTRQKRYDWKTETFGNEYLYPVSAIVSTGLVSKNTCSRKTATLTPGELIIFIRPATWWERFIWAMET